MHFKNLSFAFFICGIVFNLIILNAQESKLEESEVSKSKRVRFINKSNRKATEAIKQQDTNTGTRLASGILTQPGKTQTLRGVTVRRYLGSKNKLGADVFTIEKSFYGGHIHSISRVLSSYIQNSFGYNPEQANVLTFYVLYYNAIHRKDLAFFKKKYTPDVIKALDPNKAGISKIYKEWAGNSQILIPLEKNILRPGKTDLTIDELKEDVNKKIDKDKKPEEIKKKRSIRNSHHRENKRRARKTH